MRSRTKKIVRKLSLFLILATAVLTRVHNNAHSSDLDIDNHFNDSLSDNLLLHTMGLGINAPIHSVPSLENRIPNKEEFETRGRKLLDEYDDVLKEIQAQEKPQTPKKNKKNITSHITKHKSRHPSPPVERNLMQVMQQPVTYLQSVPQQQILTQPQIVSTPQILNTQPMMTLGQPQYVSTLNNIQQPQIMQNPQLLQNQQMESPEPQLNNDPVDSTEKEQWKKALWDKIKKENGVPTDTKPTKQVTATRKQRKLVHHGHNRARKNSRPKTKSFKKSKSHNRAAVTNQAILNKVRKDRKAHKTQVRRKNLKRMKSKLKIGKNKNNKHRSLFWKRRDPNAEKLRRFKLQIKREKEAKAKRKRLRDMRRNNVLMQKQLLLKLRKNALNTERRKTFDAIRAKKVRGAANKWNRTYVYNTILMTEKYLYNSHRKKLQKNLAKIRKAEANAIQDIEKFYEDKFLDPDREDDPAQVQKFHVFGD